MRPTVGASLRRPADKRVDVDVHGPCACGCIRVSISNQDTRRNDKNARHNVRASVRSAPLTDCDPSLTCNVLVLTDRVRPNPHDAQGATEEDMRAAAARTTLQPGCGATLAALQGAGVPLRILSANWSATLVRASLGRGGVDASEGALGAIYANELEFDASTGVSTGNIVHQVKGPLDKKTGFMGAQLASSSLPSVFRGESRGRTPASVFVSRLATAHEITQGPRVHSAATASMSIRIWWMGCGRVSPSTLVRALCTRARRSRELLSLVSSRRIITRIGGTHAPLLVSQMHRALALDRRGLTQVLCWLLPPPQSC